LSQDELLDQFKRELTNIIVPTCGKAIVVLRHLGIDPEKINDMICNLLTENARDCRAAFEESAARKIVS